MSNTLARDCWIAWFWNTPLVVYVAFPCTVKSYELFIYLFFLNVLFIYVLWNAQFFIVFFYLNRPISLCLKSARNLGIKSSYPSHPQKIKKIKIEVRSGAMITQWQQERNREGRHQKHKQCIWRTIVECGVPIILAPTKTNGVWDISSPAPNQLWSIVW